MTRVLLVLSLWLMPTVLVVNAATSGTVVAWGDNPSGETTVPEGLGGVIAIAAGGDHTVALKGDGTVVAWGGNGVGQTTVPAGLNGVTAIAAGLYHTVALVGTGPPIRVQSTGNNVTLQWTVSPLAYRVESASHLSLPVTWTNVDGPFQTNGGSISVALPISGGKKFYRLTTP